MQYSSISDIYEANTSVRTKLKQALASVNEQQAKVRPDGEDWSIAEVAEHVSIVGNGMYRICAKLLSKAEAAGQSSDVAIDLTTFGARIGEIAEIKLEAPELVRPTGTKSIEESLASLDETENSFRALLPIFEKFPTDPAKFPHPYLGDMTAVEWLAMYGLHEGRHLTQIKNILKKMG
ncbi:MAG: DinB family protein [Acidobacteria bacterium]|nr:DinB family protein [Acidobacteriota bacterium]